MALAIAETGAMNAGDPTIKHVKMKFKGTGDVHYSGDPKLTKKIAGSDEVSRVSKDRSIEQ